MIECKCSNYFLIYHYKNTIFPFYKIFRAKKQHVVIKIQEWIQKCYSTLAAKYIYVIGMH